MRVLPKSNMVVNKDILPRFLKNKTKKRKLRVFYCVCLDISWIPNKSESAVKSGVKSLRRHEHHTSAALC